MSMRGGWKCASMTNGEQSVTTRGTLQMLQPFVSRWDMPTHQVRALQPTPSILQCVYHYIISSAGLSYTNAYFGQGTGLIFMDNVQCASNDAKLLHCPSSPILQVSSTCGHEDDAGVACEGR